MTLRCPDISMSTYTEYFFQNKDDVSNSFQSCKSPTVRYMRQSKVSSFFGQFPHTMKLRQGNVFTPMCHSAHREGGLYTSIHHRPNDQGGSLSRGDLCPWGSLSKGVSVQRISVQGISVKGSLSRGVSVRETPRTVTSGRYASYWNAFLLLLEFVYFQK